MVQTIFDRRGRRYRFTVSTTEQRLLIQIFHQQMLVGEAKCLLHGAGSLELKDIAIANEADPPLAGNWLQPLIKLTGRQPQPISYRRQGLGSALLSHLIDYARDQGFKRLWGEVFRPDVENTPALLQWYQRHGFEIQPTNRPDKPDLIALVSLSLSHSK